jgi:hypothetical protein
MAETHAADKQEQQGHAGGDHRAALLAGFLGWTLDAFDFFLVVFTVAAVVAGLGRERRGITFGS